MRISASWLKTQRVWDRLSPFSREEVFASKRNVCAPKRPAALSKERHVRVEGSKKTRMIV